MGLDYLNKKVWHPGSMKNIQKVWDAQQAQLQVIKRKKQRAKKLQDQQYNQQMKRIQVQAGLIPRSHLDRMDWMYDLGNKIQQQKNNEDFIVGNKKPGKKDVKHIFQQQATNKKCQDFVLLHQDPLYAIQKQQMKARQSIVNNPIQMKSIIKEVQQDYLKLHQKQVKDKKLKHKKQRKQKKQQKQRKQRSHATTPTNPRKHHQSSRSSSSSSSSNSSNSSLQRSRDKKKQNSKLYQDYLMTRFGGILKQLDNGTLTPDYNKYRKVYKTQMQMNEQQRKQKLQQMRKNVKKIIEIKDNRQRSNTPQKISKQDYQIGCHHIRNQSFQQYHRHKNKQY